MQDRRLLGVGMTSLSVITAVGVLVILLLIATATTPEKLRQINAHAVYLHEATTSVTRGIAVSDSQHQALGQSVVRLDQALGYGAESLELAIQDTYQPQGLLDTARWPVMTWLNIIDTDAGELTIAADVVASSTAVVSSVGLMREQLINYGAGQNDLFGAYDAFDKTAKQLVGSFRQSGEERRADNVYVATEQIKKLLQTGADRDLNSVLEIVDQLEKVEADVAIAERGQLRQLINSTYTMISLRRTMNQAVATMNAERVFDQLEVLTDQTTNDQLYVLGAVNDARVLLNIYTVLLLIVLAFFGLRLQASHRALNRSHDDLELRVEERTEDLAQANEDLKESQVQLVQAEKMSSLGQLVAGVMHEINTPLLYVLNNTTVTAAAVDDISRYLQVSLPILTAKTSDEGKEAIKQLLAHRGEFDAEELAENISEVESLAADSVDGLNQISELVQSLKDFSRLDRVADDRFDVREGIEKTLTITKNLLKYGVEVRKDLKEVPEIYCSPSRLNQVFINIVTNAVQAMDGKGLLSIETSLVHSEVGDCVEIVFEDTGCGIPEEHLSKIMDPFFTTKPVGQGTGLGLSIVRQIVDQHGGQIFVDSKVDHGTRITLSFPVEGPGTAFNDADTDAEEAA